VKAAREPVGSESAGQAWKSGAEDARTPNASRRLMASVDAKRLECVRLIGAFGPGVIDGFIGSDAHPILELVLPFHRHRSFMNERGKNWMAEE
jgi:hypothetical protein